MSNSYRFLKPNRATFKGPSKSTSTAAQSISEQPSPKPRLSAQSLPLEPPTLGKCNPRRESQVMRASAQKILSPAAKRLFDMPPDSQNVIESPVDKSPGRNSRKPAPVRSSPRKKAASETIFDVLSDDEHNESDDSRNLIFAGSVLEDSPATKARNAPRCSLCHKAFVNKRELKRHSKRCR